jgi:hypothetical protein
VGKAVPGACASAVVSLLDRKIAGKIALPPVQSFGPDQQAIDISSVGRQIL